MTLTPEQFNKLVTKDYFDEVLNDRLSGLATKDDVNNLFTAMDTVVKKLDNIEHAFVSNQAAYDRFENRISRLEKHLNLSPYELVIEK